MIENQIIEINNNMNKFKETKSNYLELHHIFIRLFFNLLKLFLYCSRKATFNFLFISISLSQICIVHVSIG